MYASPIGVVKIILPDCGASLGYRATIESSVSVCRVPSSVVATIDDATITSPLSLSFMPTTVLLSYLAAFRQHELAVVDAEHRRGFSFASI